MEAGVSDSAEGCSAVLKKVAGEEALKQGSEHPKPVPLLEHRTDVCPLRLPAKPKLGSKSPSEKRFSQLPYLPLFQRYFGSEWRLAYAVAKAESGLNPKAVSRTGDYGLMQINRIHASKVGGNLKLLLDPEINLRVAKQIRDTSGWGAWVAYRNGSYKRFLREI